MLKQCCQPRILICWKWTSNNAVTYIQFVTKYVALMNLLTLFYFIIYNETYLMYNFNTWRTSTKARAFGINFFLVSLIIYGQMHQTLGLIPGRIFWNLNFPIPHFTESLRTNKKGRGSYRILMLAFDFQLHILLSLTWAGPKKFLRIY